MNGALWLLPLFAVGYALWAFFRLRRMEHNESADGIVAEDTPCRQEIIGRSRFVLDPRHSRSQAAVESETEKVTEKAGEPIHYNAQFCDDRIYQRHEAD